MCTAKESAHPYAIEDDKIYNQIGGEWRTLFIDKNMAGAESN